jgi:hypothetical protein
MVVLMPVLLLSDHRDDGAISLGDARRVDDDDDALGAIASGTFKTSSNPSTPTAAAAVEAASAASLRACPAGASAAATTRAV